MSATPATFAIRSGVEVLAAGHRGFVTRIIDLDSVLVRDADTGQIKRMRVADLAPLAASDEAAPQIDIEHVPDEDWQTAQRRLEIIRPLLERRRTRADVIARGNEFGVHVATMYTWLRNYETAGRLTALMPRERRDKGSLKLSSEVEAVIQAAIEDVYLTGQRKSITKVCEAVRHRCLNAELEPPHPNTVRNRIALLSESFQTKRRHGNKAAEQAFSPNEGEFPGADWPLSIIQIDHTKLDIILVDDIHRRPIGRP